MNEDIGSPYKGPVWGRWLQNRVPTGSRVLYPPTPFTHTPLHREITTAPRAEEKTNKVKGREPWGWGGNAGGLHLPPQTPQPSPLSSLLCQLPVGREARAQLFLGVLMTKNV